MADNSHDGFLERLQQTFRAESQERLQNLSKALVTFENETDDEQQRALVEIIFREVHSLKGAARAVDRNDIEQLCQSFESLLSQLKRRQLTSSPALADLLLKAADLLERTLLGAPPAAHELSAMCAQLDGFDAASVPAQTVATTAVATSSAIATPAIATPAEKTSPPPIERVAATERGASDTVRISTAKLDALLLKIESLLGLKLTSLQRVDDIGALDLDVAALRKSHDKNIADARTLQTGSTGDDALLRRLLEVFAQQELLLKTVDAKLAKLKKNSLQDCLATAGMVDALLDDMKQMSLQPLASAFDILPRLVRDIAHSGGKEVDLRVRGGSIEIDRRILDDLRDPLLHLVRNAIDHGIEKPAQRIEAGKPRRAALLIEATQTDGKIQITIDDDGAGINRVRVREAAVRLGKTEQEVQDDAQLLALIFESGLSTSPMVTDISGRGLGLAIVREKIEALGGAIAVISNEGRGTQFRLTLPLTLATYRGVHVLSGGRSLVFPLMHVECVTRFKPDDIRIVQDRDAVNWSGQPIALVRLSDLLALPPGMVPAMDTFPAVIGVIGDKRIAFRVDNVIGEQEVLVKNLGQQLLRVPNIAAATVLGNGSIALIVNVADLFKSAARNSFRAPSLQGGDAQPKSILVAEDSITSRMLLRGVLEAAGYRVSVAVDGEDAFEKLRSDSFDLLISDVDMPRLNGFDLTARVRTDAQLQTLPVVLVTSLASAADRERGIDVGANAYIVKSNFEEGNLVAAVQRLI